METRTLTAETDRVLDLVINSLYTRQDLFLRELVSNASDALDRLRFEAISRPELRADPAPLEIWIEADPVARTLTVRDNGIGMSRSEVVERIGSIARSGSREFAARHRDSKDVVDLIGTFGVGFYSCFMVADHVSLVTRKADDEVGTVWESTGSVEYTIGEMPEALRGTSVTLRLKPVDRDGGQEDFTAQWVIAKLIKRYADFIAYPIKFVDLAAGAADQQGTGTERPSPVVLNSQKPIWTRPASEVSDGEYTDFYKHVSNDWGEPLLRIFGKAEGRWEYSALVFVPLHAPYDLYYHAAEFGLQLYSHRMLIQEHCQELLPRYLRFLKGVVDSADLPLNVSRQQLQQAHHLVAIRRWLTKKVLNALSALRESDREKYDTLWKEFGRAIKEGVSEDPDNREALTRLLQCESSHSPSGLTTLAEYVARMPAGQQDIWYLAGTDRATIERSPHLESLRARGYEVLYLCEPVDELLTQTLSEFDGRPLRSAAKGTFDVATDSAHDEAAEEERFAGLLKALGRHLASRVRMVRLSRRMTESIACLASEEAAMSPHVEKLLRGPGTMSMHRRTLELNGRHATVVALNELFVADAEHPLIPQAADALLGIAVLAEGSTLDEPAAFTGVIGSLLGRAVSNVPVFEADVATAGGMMHQPSPTVPLATR